MDIRAETKGNKRIGGMPAPLATSIRKDRNMAMTYIVISNFQGFRQYTSRSVQSLCNVSPATAKRYLQTLEKEGLIIRQGKLIKPTDVKTMSETMLAKRKDIIDYGKSHAKKVLYDAIETVTQLSFLEGEENV